MKLSSSRGALHVELKLGELSRTIELAKAGNAVEALGVIKSNKGRDLMRDIRTALDEFDGDETNIENARNTKAALLRSVLLLVTVIAGVLAATVAILVGFTMRRQVGELRLLTASLKIQMLERENAESTFGRPKKWKRWVS